MDIGILNSNTWAKSGNFPSTLKKFRNTNKYLNDSTLLLGEGKETKCHHLVILT